MAKRKKKSPKIKEEVVNVKMQKNLHTKEIFEKLKEMKNKK